MSFVGHTSTAGIDSQRGTRWLRGAWM